MFIHMEGDDFLDPAFDAVGANLAFKVDSDVDGLKDQIAHGRIGQMQSRHHMQDTLGDSRRSFRVDGAQQIRSGRNALQE